MDFNNYLTLPILDVADDQTLISLSETCKEAHDVIWKILVHRVHPYKNLYIPDRFKVSEIFWYKLLYKYKKNYAKAVVDNELEILEFFNKSYGWIPDDDIFQYYIYSYNFTLYSWFIKTNPALITVDRLNMYLAMGRMELLKVCYQITQLLPTFYFPTIGVPQHIIEQICS